MRINRRLYIVCFTVILGSGIFVKYTNPAEAFKVPWAKLSWLIVKKTGDSWFSRNPSINFGPYATVINSGTIEFNSGSTGSHAKHVVDVDNKHYKVKVWAKTSWVNWLSKISIIITNPKGVDIVSKSVSHNQITEMHSGVYGRYSVRYISNSNESWDCWLRKDHPYKKIPYLSIVPIVSQKEKDEVNTITTDKGTFAYIEPSEEHKQDHTITTRLTLAQLQQQCFDNQKEEFVPSFKNFSVGDTIHFEDTIQFIRYNSEKNETLFGFKNADNKVIEWPFKGDLTDKYLTEMNLKLTFHVIGREGTMENIDYLQYGIDHDGQAPSIDDFQK